MIAMKLYRHGYWNKWDAFGGGEIKKIEKYDGTAARKRNLAAIQRDDEEIMELISIIMPRISQ